MLVRRSAFLVELDGSGLQGTGLGALSLGESCQITVLIVAMIVVVQV